MIKAILGLGNPGPQYYHTRHSIGFRVLDDLANALTAVWRVKGDSLIAPISLEGHEILLVKPQTFMNSSGRVIPTLFRMPLKSAELLVVHDELELPFGKVVFKTGGSAKGHNGLKSIIAVCGPDFHRIRCGIGRPDRQEDVPDYVLRPFTEESSLVQDLIERASVCALEACQKIDSSGS